VVFFGLRVGSERSLDPVIWGLGSCDGIIRWLDDRLPLTRGRERARLFAGVRGQKVAANMGRTRWN